MHDDLLRVLVEDRRAALLRDAAAGRHVRLRRALARALRAGGTLLAAVAAAVDERPERVDG